MGQKGNVSQNRPSEFSPQKPLNHRFESHPCIFICHKTKALISWVRTRLFFILLVFYLSTVYGEVDSHALSQVSIGASDPNHLGSEETSDADSIEERI